MVSLEVRYRLRTCPQAHTHMQGVPVPTNPYQATMCRDGQRYRRGFGAWIAVQS